MAPRAVRAHTCGHRGRVGRCQSRAWRAQRQSQREKCVRNKNVSSCTQTPAFLFLNSNTKISYSFGASSDSWAFLHWLQPIYNFGGKSVGRRFLFVSISIIDSIAAGLSAAVLSTKLLQEKKKKKNYKKNFFKGTLLKAGRAKIELASCVLVCGTCLHMTGTWKYHTSRWQLAVHVSRGFCCGFL